METREFSTHEDIKEFFEENPKETNRIIFSCYEIVLSEDSADEVHPFSFKEDGEEFFIEVSKSESSEGLGRLMNKAVREEHYEVAQRVKELAEEEDIELGDGDGDLEVVGAE